jgi:hypothetical protein
VSNTIRRGPQNDTSDLKDDDFPEEVTVFDDLEAALQTPIEEKIESLPVPARPGVFIRYNCDIPFDTLKRWMKSAREKTGKKEVDPHKLALIVLHAQCRGIEFEKDGKKTEYTKGGQSHTFDSEVVQNLVKTMGGWSGAVQSMYGNDGHMMMTMNRVLTEAGYGDIDLDDPDSYDPLG